MKKVLAVAAAAGVMAAASIASAASIVGSKHDLSATGTASMSGSGSSTQICVYCHAPHNAVANYPLWNRVNPGAAGFTLYSGLNMQSVSFKSSFTADSTSLFCMSCHDGVTKISAVYNAGVIEGDGAPNVKAHAAKAGAFYNNPLGASASTNLTKDLSKTHPVNFQVVASNNSQADLNVGTGSVMGPGVAPGYGYAATETFPLFKTTDANGLRAGNRSLECGSCHAVHDSLNSPFLRYTMTGSRLCLGCHNK